MEIEPINESRRRVELLTGRAIPISDSRWRQPVIRDAVCLTVAIDERTL